MPRHATRRSDKSRAGTQHAPAPQQVVPRLLEWFAIHARDLPWRRTRDPYAIWVSEIMLQQTQVKTVIPYWERWMRALPTIESLASAMPEKIHKLWEGLGYYTRVRNMQKAAQLMVGSGSAGTPAGSFSKRPAGKGAGAPRAARFPENFDDILALPGIGRYTAGAIASIAFNQPAPILDGNVIRVLTRLHGIAEDPHEKKTNARLWQLAGDLVHAAAQNTQHATPINPGPARSTPSCSALNQSLMELGALVCTPRSPQCSACPVASNCIALCENRVEEIPRPKQRAAVTSRRFLVFIIERNGKFLVQQRAAGVVNAHLWEFPNVEVAVTRHSVRAAFLSFANGAQGTDAPYQADDFQVDPARPFCVVKHSITRYRMTAEAYRVTPGETGLKLPGVWRTLAHLHKLPFTAAHRQIASRLGNP